MRCPPEPLFQLFLNLRFCCAGPEVTEAFFEERGPVDFQVHSLKADAPSSLLRGQVPGILEPDVPAVFHAILARFAFFTDLIAPDLVGHWTM
jgi:hypothetical protein